MKLILALSAILFCNLSYATKLDDGAVRYVISHSTHVHNIGAPQKPSEPAKGSFMYFKKFDTSAAGSGKFYDEDTRVVLPSANKTSKPTFPILKSSTDEARVRFSVGGSNFANGPRIINTATGKGILMWYNHNNSIYLTDQQGVAIKTIPVGQGSEMEIRLNFKTSEWAFVINENIVYKDVVPYEIPDSLAVVVFEGSSSVSSLTLLPGAH